MNRRMKFKTPLLLIFAGMLTCAGNTALAAPQGPGVDVADAADQSDQTTSQKPSSGTPSSPVASVADASKQSYATDDRSLAGLSYSLKPKFLPLFASRLFPFRLDNLSLPNSLPSNSGMFPPDQSSGNDQAGTDQAGTDQTSSTNTGTEKPTHPAEDANQPNSQFPPWALYSNRNVDPRVKYNGGIRLPQIFPNFSPIVPDYDRTLLDTKNWSLKVSLAQFFVNPDPKSAKFEEFRDVRDGVVTGVEAHYRDRNYFLNAVGRNLGRNDEDLNIDGGIAGKYIFSFYDDETPHNYMFGAKSLYTGIGTGNLVIADSIRADIQNNSTSLADAATTLATYDAQQGQSVDLKLKRDKVGGDVTIMATYPWAIKVGASNESRNGERPWSGSFGFADFVEIPWAVHYDTYDVHINAEWTKPESRIYFNAGFKANLFYDHVESETFSNPLRITDSNSLVGTYTAGPAEGRLALYPSNQYFEPSAVLVVKRLPWDSTLSAMFSAGFIHQNEELQPFSTNTSDTVYNLAGTAFNATDPTALPRPTADASINTQASQVRWTAQPTNHFHLNTEYRLYRSDVTTPRFVFADFVREDQDVRTPTAQCTEPCTANYTFSSLPIGYTRQTATISGDYDFGHDSRLGFTYTFEDWDRHLREVKHMDDNRLRISYNVKTKKWLELKSWYEHTIRTTSTYDFNQWHVAQGDSQEITAFPMLRKIDEAPYHKDDVQVMATVPLGSSMSVSAHGLFGKTLYDGQTFGLLDNSHQSYGVDYSYDISDSLSFFADYGFEKFHSRLHDRTWTPGDACDPLTQAPGYASACNWTGVPEDSYNTVGLGFDTYLIPKKFHYTLSYTFSKSHGTQDYSGGGGVDNPFVPLNFPNVDSETSHTINNELEYKFTKALALVAGYQYESWNIADYNYVGFNYVNQFNAFNFLPLPGVNLLMGGLLPPAYHANIAFARLKFGF
jgi:hypothetical protein